ncbi:MAG: UDP-N-acetylmuramoyl-tripeptide--D-alanyl-D-alanine ligase [Deltaproteobacteria bacterium]|nr:UDP-N-acetylmuramoyl-tripeptide--D-alanyl-D-alanine ligase [Deltaproteobacteria bacterium]
MPGTATFDARWVANACGGRVVGDPDLPFDRFVRDSREDLPGACFVALRGENHDGHSFVPQVLGAGAAAVLVEDAASLPGPPGPGSAAIVVPNAVHAIADVARAHRRRMPARVLGLTGSCGKTTTKDMLRAILSRVGPTLATEGNLNNHLGVPFTLFGLRPEHRFAVVEMGCNHPGEIANLAAIAEPDIGLITCVAPAHLEGLGSLEGIARAKGELFAALDRPDATAIVNLDDPLVAALPTGRARRVGVRRAGGGEEVSRRDAETQRAAGQGGRRTAGRSDVTIGEVTARDGGQTFRLRLPDGTPVDLDLSRPGRHMVMDAALAAAAAWAAGAGPQTIADGLSSVGPGKHRGEIHTSLRGVVVLDDTYNANPGSVRSALQTLSTLPGQGRKVAVLGEMLELGDAAPELHRQIGEAAGRAGMDLLLCAGPNAARTVDGARAAGLADEATLAFETTEALVAVLGGLLRPGDRVLVKGSRGMRMERVVEGILRGPGADAV